MAAWRGAANPSPYVWKAAKQALESRFSGPRESTIRDLEKTLKKPILSVVYGSRLCARRNPLFMAQIGPISPRRAWLDRDILKGLI
jgi:hypothetical protein